MLGLPDPISLRKPQQNRYEICGLIGSIITGFLYEYSILGVVIFAMTIQFISIPLFLIAHRKNIYIP